MPVVVAVGSAAGHAKVKGAGAHLPPNPWANYVAWSLMINGSIIEGVGYDPFAKNLYVLYPNGQYIIVPNMPIGVTNAIQAAPDPQAYVLALIETAVYPPPPPMVSSAVGSAVGSGSASATSKTIASSVGSASGVATASALSPIIGVGSASGAGTASGVQTGTFGSAVGVGTATGVGVAITTAVGSASGAGTATGQSGSATGSATGVGTASGVGASTVTAVGSATGAGTASGVSRGLIIATGSATGTATASASSVSRCPQGFAYADGCAGSPAGTGTTSPGAGSGLYQNTAFFTYCLQSGQGPYAVTPPWNVAGVHYPVGIPASVTLADPTVSVPPGCTLHPTGSVLGGPMITAAPSATPLTISGYDFSLHGGVPLLVGGASQTGLITITNNKFVTGANITSNPGQITASITGNVLSMTALLSGRAPAIGDTVQGAATAIAGTPTISAIVSAWNGSAGTYDISVSQGSPVGSQTVYLGTTQHYLVEVQNGTPANVVFNNNYADGNALNFPLSLFGGIILDNAGSLTAQYNAFLRMPARPITTVAHGAISCLYNYVEGFVYSPSDGHGEFIINAMPASVTQPSAVYSFNTLLGPSNILPDGGTSMFFFDTANPGVTITLVQADHNTCVTNLNSGQETISIACAEIGNVTVTNSNFTDNYFDTTGTFGPTFVFLKGVSAVLTNPTAFSGNISMLDGSSMNAYH